MEVSGVVFHRRARVWPVVVPGEPLALPSVPTNRRAGGSSRWQALMPIVGSLAMVGFAFVVRSLIYMLLIGVMVLGMVGATLGVQLGANREERRRWARTRQRYLELVDARMGEAKRAAEQQRSALLGLYPAASELLELVPPGEVTWERRREDYDFGWARLGTGRIKAARPVVITDNTTPLEEPDPELAEVANDAVSKTAEVDGAPITVPLASLGVVAVVADDPERARSMVRAWLASLAALHAPGDLRIAGLFPPEAESSWDWLKWLPHCRGFEGAEGLGRASRSVTVDPQRFEEMVGELARQRLAHARKQPYAAPDGTSPSPAPWEHAVVVVDGWRPEASPGALGTLMARAGEAAVTVVVLVEDPSLIPSEAGATVSFSPEGLVLYIEGGPGGRVQRAQPDQLTPEDARRLARHIAPLRLGWEGPASGASDSVRLCELLGAEDAREAAKTAGRVSISDLLGRAVPPRALLSTPVGRDESGNPVQLDLKEAAAGGMGPHGIMVGATGSGKSELLRSLTVALAAGHDPGLLNFLLVDWKGGAAFAGLEELPHVAGLVTNLAEEPDLIARVKAALSGELERRQRLLKAAGNFNSVSEYHAAGAGAARAEALPYLVVVVDEFGELLATEPNFIELFNAIGRLGRSLGVHLLLATQRLDEGRIRLLEPHLRYRFALRTYTPSESQSILGSPAAYELAPVPGLGYLAVDESLTKFKAAISTLPYRPAGRAKGPLNTASLRSLTLRSDRAAASEENGESATVAGGEALPDLAGQPQETELQALVQGIRALGGPPAGRIWLPPLPAAVTLGSVARAFPGEGQGLLLGLVDLPRAQQQLPLSWDPHGTGGNLGIAGAPRTGKSTFLVTLALALAERNRPDQVQVYCLDLGGGSLFSIETMPHVGAVVGPGENDAAARLLKDMRALVEERSARRRSGATEHGGRPADPEVFLLVDNVGMLRQAMPDLEAELGALSNTGLHQGVHVVLSANRWYDVRPALLDALGTKLELRLGDPGETLSRREEARSLPVDRPGRGLTREGQLFQLALPSWHAEPGADGEAVALAEAVEEARSRAGDLKAPRVAALPPLVEEAGVAALAEHAGSPGPVVGAGFLLGVSEFRCRPVQAQIMAPGAHLAVYGDAGSGRTTLLARALSYACSERGPSELRVHIIDPARNLAEGARDPHVDNYATGSAGAQRIADALVAELSLRLPPESDGMADLSAAAPDGPLHLLVVDDYDLLVGPLGSPLTSLAELVAHAGAVGLHVFLARRVAGTQRTSFEPFSQRLRELRPLSLVLSGSPEEGFVVGNVKAQEMPPGRAWLVARGARPELIQLCLPSQPTVPQDDAGLRRAQLFLVQEASS